MKIKNLMIVMGTLLLLAVFNGCSNNNENVAFDYENRAFITVSTIDEIIK